MLLGVDPGGELGEESDTLEDTLEELKCDSDSCEDSGEVEDAKLLDTNVSDESIEVKLDPEETGFEVDFDVKVPVKLLLDGDLKVEELTEPDPEETGFEVDLDVKVPIDLDAGTDVEVEEPVEPDPEGTVFEDNIVWEVPIGLVSDTGDGEDDANCEETWVEIMEIYGPQAYFPCILGALTGHRKFSKQV